MSEKKMRYCFNCGAELGEYSEWEALDHCGAPECAREARAAIEAEREERHRQVDEDYRW